MIVRPVSVVPEASFNVAESVFVSPTRRLAELGETVTLATAGSETTIAAESRCPSLVAKIHALPAGTGPEVESEPDRRRALALAVSSADPVDVIVVSGKGHEQGQEFEGGRKLPFDDVAVAREALRARLVA